MVLLWFPVHHKSVFLMNEGRFSSIFINQLTHHMQKHVGEGDMELQTSIWGFFMFQKKCFHKSTLFKVDYRGLAHCVLYSAVYSEGGGGTISIQKNIYISRHNKKHFDSFGFFSLQEIIVFLFLICAIIF